MTSGGSRWTRSSPIRSAVSDRTTSTTTTYVTGGPARSPSYTHSLELRLLAHTGIVGFVLFATFMVAAIAAVMPRSAAPRARGVRSRRRAAAAVVWLIYGSIDWFWEMPALSGPGARVPGRWRARSGRLALPARWRAPADGRTRGQRDVDAPRRSASATSPRPTPTPAWIRVLAAGAGVVALLAALYALGSGLSVRARGVDRQRSPRERPGQGTPRSPDRRGPQSAERRSRAGSAARSPSRPVSTPRPGNDSSSRSPASPEVGMPGWARGWPPRRSATGRPRATTSRWRRRSTLRTL